MAVGTLHTRFLLAGCLLVAATVGIGLWSAAAFARLSAVVGDALRASQETIDLSAALAESLEREDDALLLALGSGRAATLAGARRRTDDCYRRLVAALHDGEDRERSIAANLRSEIDRYRAAGSALAAAPGRTDAGEAYHKAVNPLLRQAVASCGRIREENFQSMQAAGVRARDEANRATWVVAAGSALAIALTTAVSAWLARSVVGPVRALTAAVDALRAGDFDVRSSLTSPDDLGRLAAGFNRMAETLTEYRRSSLGELLAAKTTLEATLDALPDAVLVFGPDGALVAQNPPARAVLEALAAGGARHLAELPLRPEHRVAVEAALAGRASTPPRAHFAQALAVTVAGRPRRFLLTAMPIPEFAPQRVGAAAVLADVTEFARLDELRSELIGVASHELKTPLTTLHVNLLLLTEQAANLTERQREMLAAAAAGCEELGDTIDELLDVTRIEAGQLRLNLAPVDPAAVARQVVASLGPRFADAGVSVEVIRDGPPALVSGDAARLRVVLANLLTNALKYSPPGGQVTVRVAPAPEARGGGPAVLVTVTDQGPGVPEPFRERVFEKFFRVEHHRGQEAGGVRGTGIGLYLCREIIEAHAGAIHCEPGPAGAGTRIAFTLPALRLP